MVPALPLTRDLVLIGGGHAHALVLRMWGMRPLPGVRLTLVNPYPAAAYSGMLPGFIAGHYGRDDLGIDLVRLARFAGARLVLSRATGIDRENRRIAVEGRPPVAYDIASLDIGITSGMDLPGFAGHAVPAKPLDSFARRWAAFADSGGGPVAVIGGGAAGCEIAMAARHRLGPGAQVTVIEASTPLAGTGRRARQAILAALRDTGVTLLAGVPAAAVHPGAVLLADGREVPSAFTIGAAATRAAPWLRDTGLALEGGFVAVDALLRTITDPSVFAAGDIAHFTHAPRPKAGVFAVRAAPVLFRNLTVALTGRGAMRHFRPQGDYLKLVSLGAKRATADKWGLSATGGWVWRWKDRIDRRFMAMFDDLPAMPADPPPALRAAGEDEIPASARPLCGGCGAKVGQADLKAAIAALPAPSRPDVLAGAGDDAAVLAVGSARQILTTDHVRAFTEDPWTLARITAIHAMGDIWAMGGRPQAALAQVILPRMTPRMQAETLREILDAAARTFRAAGADVAGGHTSLGAELTVGFTVTGLLDRDPIGQSGARPGDALILTKPLGTGVILAAEMARAAPGTVVAGAFAAMLRPQGAASAILSPHARAMTDVTGFGLTGHLMGLLDASGVAAVLSLSAIPVLAGAEALAAAGHGSTLLPANRAVASRMFLTPGPRADLLFDPQTAGGLLAAVPGEVAGDLVARLREAGDEAAVIGHVTGGAPFVTVGD
ncbi:MAG: selenide, water dikinase SelD [Pseudomonadota bacterium]